MTYTISNVVGSIATLLKSQYPDYNIYASAVPQGVTTPCFFIAFMPSSSKSEVDARYLNELHLDIVFLSTPNQINITETAYGIIEFLDENLETFSYYDDFEEAPVGVMHSYDRNTHFEDMDLHYQLTIKARGHFEVTSTLMTELEAITYEIKRK
jgi:hypothetical protein